MVWFVVSKITNILEMLCDGKCHGLDELREKIRLTEFQVIEAIRFLSQYNFVKVSQDSDRIEVSKDVQEFFAQTQAIN